MNNRLKKVVNQQTNNAKKPKNIKIPEYNSSGKVVKIGNEGLKKRLGIAIIVVSALFVVFYLPGLFMKDKTEETNSYVKQPDISSIKLMNDYYSMSKDKDFDGDGLSNSAEDEHGTNPWSRDTDGDGMDDYYEIYVSKTDPNEYDSDALIKLQESSDQATNTTVETPYKCSNVIMWAKNIHSKAYGGVIETPKGYHFSNFEGYAQFPQGSGSFAYTNDNGRYELLPYDTNASAWKINNIHNVELFNTEIEQEIEYRFFGKPVYVKLNAFGKIMNFILPKKGIISAQLTTREDIEPTSQTYTIADNNNIVYDSTNGDRFGRNTNTLQDLQFVRSMIDENRCVEVSLYDVNDGELRAIIYGYTNDNTLYVADEDTLETLGCIYVNEIGRKSVDKDGNYGLSSYFSWYGLGFSSASYDRISFFAVAEEESDIISTVPANDEVETETTTEVSEEMTTEIVETASPTDTEEVVYDIKHKKTFKTGEWDHSLRGFEVIMEGNGFGKYEGNDKDIVDNIIEEYGESVISTYKRCGSADGNIIYSCMLVSDHDKGTEIYKKLLEQYKEKSTDVTYKNKKLYLQTIYTYEDKSSIFIRRYADDSFIISFSKNGITDEIKNINKQFGTKKP